MSSIKTPDQRVRVFISSTIKELEAERKVAREAIENLRLIPVFFESGARPHPPRDLYRAYLDQSHIFVGIYWNSYGWVAPDMEISGLEDEFRLSTHKVRLIYVKHSDDRSPELIKLLHDIQGEAVTFQRFNTPEEFKELLANDLALLLSERFESESQETFQKHIPHNLPFIRSALIGREKELKTLEEMLFMPEVGLLTITGAGGTGKSRLALELAHDVGDKFRDGVYFILLASLSDPMLVAPNIAHGLGLIDTGSQPIQETLIAFLIDKKTLLILDNFEHVLGAGSFISELLSTCRQIKIIVTSRAPLRIRNERIFPLAPLATLTENAATTADDTTAPSVKLFLERAQEVNSTLQLSAENLEAINEICRRLDGLPLAIELAAARIKLLTPVALLQRMKKSLDILSHGPRDLPERHQTIRATIDWSYNLLDESARVLFRHLAIFSDGWTLESSEAVVRAAEVDIDVLDDTDKLLNVGLIHAMESTTSHSAEPRFGMLLIVREYALEILRSNDKIAEAQLRHARYFSNLLELALPDLWQADPLPWLERLDAEYQNISHAISCFIEAKDLDAAWGMIGALAQYWSSRGRFSEAFSMMDMANVRIDTNPSAEQIRIKNQASAMFALGLLTFLSGRFTEATLYLNRSIRQFAEVDSNSGIARAKTYLGAALISFGDESAIPNLEESMALGDAEHDEFSFVMSSAFLADIYSNLGDFEKAQTYLSLAEEHGRRSPIKVILAVALLQKASFYIMQDNYEKSLEACEESVEMFLLSGFKSMKGWAQAVMGQGHFATGDFESAGHDFAGSISSAREVGDKSMLLFGLMGFGALALAGKQLERAGILLGVVESIIQTTGYAFWSSDKKLYHMLVNQLTEQVSESDLKKFRLEGAALSQEKAIALALSDLSTL